MALAAEESAGLLKVQCQHLTEFLCKTLRREAAPWCASRLNTNSEEFLQFCRHHGVQSLVYDLMRNQEEWETWPQEIRLALEQSSRVGVAADLLRAHYLARILSQLSSTGVRSLLTKGEALAATHYTTPGTRVRCDSDVFISMDDVELAMQAAQEAGFRIVSPVYKSHQFTVVRPEEFSHLFEFDIHWRILNNPRYARVLSFDEAFASSEELPGASQSRVLSPANALLLACMHRFASEFHDRDRLIWIYDIHLLVSAMSPNQLVDFAAKAVSQNVQITCQDGLNKSSEYFGTVLSTEVMDRLGESEMPRTLIRRYSESSLGLLVDDWINLPGSKPRHALLSELFLPSVDSLMDRYGKNNRSWLPLLWLRQVFGGLAQRLMLR